MPGSVSFIQRDWIRVYCRVWSPFLGPCVPALYNRKRKEKLAPADFSLGLPWRWQWDEPGQAQAWVQVLLETRGGGPWDRRHSVIPNPVMRSGHRRPLLEAHRGGEKVAKPSGAQTNFPFSTRQTASLTPSSHCPFTPHGANICVLSELPLLAPRGRWTAHSWPCVSWASHSREEITEVFGQEEWEPACENLSSLCQNDDFEPIT